MLGDLDDSIYPRKLPNRGIFVQQPKCREQLWLVSARMRQGARAKIS